MKKILINSLSSSIGNTLIITPLIKKLKASHPDSQITVLVTSKISIQVLENNPYLDKIILLRRTDFRIRKVIAAFFIIRLLRFRKAHLDISITTFPHRIYNDVVTKVMGAKQKIAHKMHRIDSLYDQQLKIEKVHDIRQNLNLLKPLGIKSKLEPPKIYLTEKEKSQASKFLLENRIKNRKIVGIHPGCDERAKFKRWSIDKCIKLARKLVKNYNVDVLFFIGPSEKDMLSELEELKRDKINIIQETDLRKVFAFISNCNLFISNDSGIMHIAESLNVPLVAIFGPSDPLRIGPVSKNSIVMRKKLKCSPCSHTLKDLLLKKKSKEVGCKKLTCLNEISVKDVLKACKKFL